MNRSNRDEAERVVMGCLKAMARVDPVYRGLFMRTETPRTVVVSEKYRVPLSTLNILSKKAPHA